jgi:hypothetical protein
MNKNTQQEMNPVTLLIIGLIVLTAIGSMFGGGSGSSGSYTSASPDRTSSDYRYVERRMQREGMSQSEARQAADAVIKFHEAQKAK